ncbi:hypothetical protein L2E82_10946 [Cichorium intybus]|uniref:Uncharacterized protein n=1 Tax=Cichorium intybus TaxID=13427 RepID=A0ACB9GCK7_CICIN|nr:hypothetical protein L2E82_10946 [Cichorium intybus]
MQDQVLTYYIMCNVKTLSLQDAIDEIPDLETSFAAFHIKPLQALKGYFAVREDDAGDENLSENEQHERFSAKL